MYNALGIWCSIQLSYGTIDGYVEKDIDHGRDVGKMLPATGNLFPEVFSGDAVEGHGPGQDDGFGAGVVVADAGVGNMTDRQSQT